jgi:hypothetical protein
MLDCLSAPPSFLPSPPRHHDISVLDEEVVSGTPLLLPVLDPSFPLRGSQNTQKYHFSQEFIAKCTEIVWKELRYPLKTLIDYHEEYLSFTAKCICSSEIDSFTPSLLQHLTTFKFAQPRPPPLPLPSSPLLDWGTCS